MKLDGFGIFVNDISVMIRFYRDVLDLKSKKKIMQAMYFWRKTELCFFFIEEVILKR